MLNCGWDEELSPGAALRKESGGMIIGENLGGEDDGGEEIEEVDEYAELKGKYEEYKWEDLSLSERAAAAGDYQRVKALLKEGLEKGEIQKAFAAAAYNDRKVLNVNKKSRGTAITFAY